MRQSQIVQSLTQDCQYVLSHLLPVCNLLIQDPKITFFIYLFIYFILFSTTVHYLQYNTYNTYLQFDIANFNVATSVTFLVNTIANFLFSFIMEKGRRLPYAA